MSNVQRVKVIGDAKAILPFVGDNANFCGGTPTALWNGVCPEGEGYGGPGQGCEVGLDIQPIIPFFYAYTFYL